MKCIIVDDEASARRSLVRLCENIEDLNVVASCTSEQEVMRLLKKEPVDLLFVASRLPQIPSQDLGNESPQVIMVTDGKEDTGLIGQQAIDFLSKPISVDRLHKAVERVRLRKRLLKPDQDNPNIYVKHQGKLVRIKYDDILFIEKIGGAVCEVNTLFQTYEVDMTFYEIGSKLKDLRFAKVQRHFIVNLKKVLSIGETSLTVGSKVISISRASRPMLVRQMESLR